MTPKKVIGLIGVILCVLLLLLVALQVITWQLFWMGIILLGGLAYHVIPGMDD